MKKRIFFGIVLLLSSNSRVFSQESFTVEQRFHDLFLTAGYTTIFGAALGAAVVGLSTNPSANLKYIAMGASLGFICGSALGTYFVFVPSFATRDGYAAESEKGAYGTRPPTQHEVIPIPSIYPSSVYLSPHVSDSKLEGMKISWVRSVR